MLEKIRFGVVRIQSNVQVKNIMKPGDAPEGEESFVGSGFIVLLNPQTHDDPLIVTNAHVVSDAKSEIGRAHV